MSTYQKQPRSGAAGRIANYFESNPDEELTEADVCVKFQIKQATVRSVVSALKQQGLVSTERVTFIRAPKQHGAKP